MLERLHRLISHSVRRWLAVAIAILGFGGLVLWREELFTVSRGTLDPAALDIRPIEARTPAAFDAVLPMVPIGMLHLQPSGGVQVIHFWAPWMRHATAQAVALDSLRKGLPPGDVRFAVVCFDPFPSVSRFLRRNRLSLPLVLDHHHALGRDLPCPSIPYTYVIDSAGRTAAVIEGEIDWLAPATREALLELVHERDARRDTARVAISPI